MNDACKNGATPTGGNRYFTFSLPVTFQLQFTFPEAKVEDADSDDPEIRSEALRELEEELLHVLGQDYAVSDLDVADDGLAALFLGKYED